MSEHLPIPDDSPSSRAGAAYTALRTAIIEAALPPGTRLGEDRLGNHFGVSRTLIRSTLARLTVEGLVESGGAKSARVAHPTIEEGRDTFAVRRALEREVIRELADAWSPEVATRLRAHVAAEREALAEHNAQRSGRLAAEFHIELAAACGNALLHRYMSEVVSRTALILSIYGRELDQAGSIDEHEILIGLLEGADAAAAISHVDTHVASVEVRALQERPDEDALDVISILSRY